LPTIIIILLFYYDIIKNLDLLGVGGITISLVIGPYGATTTQPSLCVSKTVSVVVVGAMVITMAIISAVVVGWDNR
jgi:hypothetical protein